MSEYKDALTAAMLKLAEDPLVRFVGYGVKIGGRAAGTLKNVPDEQLIETPVAENLMVGMAIGLALRGLRPVVFIERCDFILNAMDAIVNHLDKIAAISQGEFEPAVILRVVVGNSKSGLRTGATHTQDFSESLDSMLSFPVWRMVDVDDVELLYESAYERLRGREFSGDGGRSTMLIEYKDML